MEYPVSAGKMALSVIVLVAVLAFYLFANSPFFETDYVEWTGLRYLDQEQLNIYFAFPSTNVWRMNTTELKAILLEHPWIEKAEIRWRWPNRVIISVQEKMPLAQVPGPGGWFLLDKAGSLLPASAEDLVYPLPIVTNLPLDSDELLVITARLIGKMPESLNGIISEWNVATRSFITRSGTEILFGAPEEIEEKYILLERILDDLAERQEQAAKIDLRTLRNPVVSIL